MKIFKYPFVAVFTAIFIVLSSTIITSSIKLNNKCEGIIDGFYTGASQQASLMPSICTSLYQLCDVSSDIVAVADNYGVKTKDLSKAITSLRESISYRNTDIRNIYNIYEELYTSLRSVVFELSSKSLSQRHIEYITEATAQIATLKQNIDNAGYNESVKIFYKRFDKFPVKHFAEFFEIDYPELFA